MHKANVLRPLLPFLTLLWISPSVADIAERPEVRAFIDQLIKQDGFDETNLLATFKQVTLRPEIIESIQRPAEAKPWHLYWPIFLTPQRIQGGVKFWAENESILQRAEEKYGVPAEIIVAIIGVETKYGEFKGKFPVIDALSTLGFDYPKRGEFFREQLREFLILSREENMDAITPLGSYAGAMGKPQFMPSSYRNYAVDFDADGKRDLIENNADVIGSVANYFVRHDWKTGGPIATRAKVKGKQYREAEKKGIKPQTSIAELKKAGITVVKNAVQKVDNNEQAALIVLELAKGKEYWLGLNNFYVITRYNHSELYAMAVYQLSKEITHARKQALAKKKR